MGSSQSITFAQREVGVLSAFPVISLFAGLVLWCCSHHGKHLRVKSLLAWKLVPLTCWERTIREMTVTLLGLRELFCVLAQSCLTPRNPMDCSRPGSSVHGIFQVRILEWLAISFRKSSWSRNRTHISWVSWIGRQILYHWVTWEAHMNCSNSLQFSEWFILWLHILGRLAWRLEGVFNFIYNCAY